MKLINPLLIPLLIPVSGMFVVSEEESCRYSIQFYSSHHTERMPEIEKQASSSSIQEGDSNVKPGGLRFEVVLEDAKTDEKPILRCPPTPTLSVEDIEKKLKVSKEMLNVKVN